MSGILGIDIGRGSMKLVSIGKDVNGAFSLEYIGESKVSMVDEKDINDSKRFGELVDGLKSILNDLKIKNSAHHWSMPGQQQFLLIR